ncbi:MAG: ComEC family competence protein [Rhodobacteraceae bacterium]|nr:ComEC family competence protein [Paracoccaceae bacterium]
MPVLTEVFFAQRTRLFCWIPVWLACGIGLYFSLRFEPGFRHVMWAASVVFCCLVPALLLRSIWRALFWVPLLVALGFLIADLRGNLAAGAKLGWHYYGAVEGTVTHLDRSASNRLRVTLSEPTLENTPPWRTPRLVRVSVQSDAASTALLPGARVMMTASLSPPAGPVEPGGFDFQRKAWFLGLGATGYTRLPVVLARPADGSGFALRLFALRMHVSEAIKAQLPGQSGAFAAAIVTGDRSAIDPAILGDLRRSNLAHLLAISGLHMGLLTGFIFALVRYSFALFPYLALRLPTKKIAAVVALLAGLAYLMISGANVATQRAFIMVAVILIAVLLDRPAITLRAVAVAAIVILLWRPESLTGPGFQMSFAATTALVATFEWLNRQTWWWRLNTGRGRLMRGAGALVVSSAVAGAATAPISAFHFNQIAQYGLLANLASVPVMGFVVMPAAVIAGLLSLAGAQSLALAVMGYGIAWILQVAGFVAHLDGSVTRLPAASTAVLAILALGAAFLVLWRGRLRIIGVFVALFAFGLWSQEERPAILITDNGRLVGLQSDAGRALNRTKGNGFAARVWLENDGDYATQNVAANRMEFAKDDWVIALGGQKVGYVWDRKATPEALQERCFEVDILIAPNLKQNLSSNCITLNKNRFRKEGAFALVETTQGVGIVSARQVSGTRLWNR